MDETTASQSLWLRILNVDDNESGRYIKTRVLRQGGYEVVEARTGVEALETARRAKPDLVLLDVKLPDVSGFEVCRMIKESTPKLLVLQISASFVAPRDRAAGLDSGADAYLSQPVEPSELLATVRALLRLKKAEQAAQESNELYRVIVQSATDYAIVTLGLDGRVRTWSTGAQRLLGWSEGEMSGQPVDRPKINEVCFGFSRDGFHWSRPMRDAFCPVSETREAWNWGNVQSAGGCCLVVGDKLYFYAPGQRTP